MRQARSRIAASASLWKAYLSGRRVLVNSHGASGGRNRPHPVTRHRNTGGCSEPVAHFFCGLHDPLWLCRAHYVLARISSKCRRAECQREHDTCASNRRTAQATEPAFCFHALILSPLRILRKLIQSSFRTKKPHFEPYTCRLCRGSYRLPLQGLAFGAPISIRPKKVFQAQMVQAGLGFFPSVPTGGSQSLVNRGRRLPF